MTLTLINNDCLQNPKEIKDLDLSEEEMAALQALNGDDELAALPSKEELFGEQLEALANEYKGDKERLEEAEKENQKKVAQSLEEKLASRRQRRARKNLEEKELNALGN